jgi:retinol-binding protein 3
MHTESRRVSGVCQFLTSAVVVSLMSVFALTAHGQEKQPGVVDAQIRKEVLDDLATQLENRYVLPDMAKKLANTVRAKQKSKAYDSINSSTDLARALTDDLYAVARDKHLRVSFNLRPMSVGPGGLTPKEFNQRVRLHNGMIPKVEVLEGNVGYMRVNGVPSLEVARDSIAAAFAFLQRTDALIIDNRANGGGDPNTVALYMSYLSEREPYVVNRFHWRTNNRVEEFKTTDLGKLTYGERRPVFVLTSAATFSGGEELAYDVQAFKRGVIVGEVTGGGANPGGPVALVHQFSVNMPGGRAVNPVTQTNWEGVGVKPDVPVPAEKALSKAHGLAIERLLADARDSETRARLEAAAARLQASSAP